MPLTWPLMRPHAGCARLHAAFLLLGSSAEPQVLPAHPSGVVDFASCPCLFVPPAGRECCYGESHRLWAVKLDLRCTGPVTSTSINLLSVDSPSVAISNTESQETISFWRLARIRSCHGSAADIPHRHVNQSSVSSCAMTYSAPAPLGNQYVRECRAQVRTRLWDGMNISCRVCTHWYRRQP